MGGDALGCVRARVCMYVCVHVGVPACTGVRRRVFSRPMLLLVGSGGACRRPPLTSLVPSRASSTRHARSPTPTRRLAPSREKRPPPHSARGRRRRRRGRRRSSSGRCGRHDTVPEIHHHCRNRRHRGSPVRERGKVHVDSLPHSISFSLSFSVSFFFSLSLSFSFSLSFFLFPIYYPLYLAFILSLEGRESMQRVSKTADGSDFRS